LLNKVAGVYGLITIVTGGSVAQLSMYFYSIAVLVGIWWFGLKVVLAVRPLHFASSVHTITKHTQEHPKYTFYLAYAFLLDHVFSTVWLAYFAVEWWVYTPHDGRRVANSAAQEELMKSVTGHEMSAEERRVAAQSIWNHEKGTAAGVVVVSWLIKVRIAYLPLRDHA
jgi:inositol phosphorylceramide synthase regulatory subunit